MDTARLHELSVASWLERVEAIGPDDWSLPTPCSEWSVRDLVNHVVGEDRWTGPLLQGRTIDEVGDSLAGDLLGADPGAAAAAAGAEAVREVGDRLTPDLRVHLSYGEEAADEYLMQLVADHVVHAWDLASATGGDRDLDPELIDAVAGWFAEREDLYREAGLVGDRVETDAPGPQAGLLASAGRDPRWSQAHAVVGRLADAFGAGDVDAIMAVMGDDCVFESTSPAPDGERVEGAAAVRAVFADLFSGTPGARFETEELVALGDRAVLRWRFSWEGDEPGHVRGVDVLRVTSGRVTEKFSYVKG